MNKTKTEISTRQLISQLQKIITTIIMTLQILLIGCASSQHKVNSIHDILKKENVLIEKIKAERSNENIRQALEQSEALQRAESHLLISLDEIIKANEVVTLKLNNSNKQEATNGKNE